jgi:hypothetical protein
MISCACARKPHIRFAGQITGVEGYVESAAMGLLAGRMAAAELLGARLDAPPRETAMGALVHHITGGAEAKTFQPMNVNFGLFPPIDAKGGRRGRRDRYKAYTDRAKDAFNAGWAMPGAMRPEGPVTRFAPSPTGPLHLGHAYAALVAAQRGAGRFLLRIEDIDQSRCRAAYEAQIYADLRWLGLEWPEPVMRQSTRLGLTVRPWRGWRIWG